MTFGQLKSKGAVKMLEVHVQIRGKIDPAHDLLYLVHQLQDRFTLKELPLNLPQAYRDL